MLLYPLYKSIKQQLNSLGINTFFFLKQYEASKDNTSYKVPAIYIEMPNYRGTALQFYGKKLMSAKNLEIKIHYISYAPFKNHTNTVQDNALQQHSSTLIEIDKLLNGHTLKDASNNPIAEQLKPVLSEELNFMNSCVVSVITYNCEAYLRHLQ